MKLIYLTIAVLFTVVQSGEKGFAFKTVLDLTTFIFSCFEFGDTVDRLIQPTYDHSENLFTILRCV